MFGLLLPPIGGVLGWGAPILLGPQKGTKWAFHKENPKIQSAPRGFSQNNFTFLGEGARARTLGKIMVKQTKYAICVLASSSVECSRSSKSGFYCRSCLVRRASHDTLF